MDARSTTWLAIGGTLLSIAGYLISTDYKKSALCFFVLGSLSSVFGICLIIQHRVGVLEETPTELNLSTLPPKQTSKLQVKENPQDLSPETTERIKPLKPPYYPPSRPLAPHEGMGGIPFPQPSKPGWSEYTQDMFYNVIWRWHYKLQFDSTPRDLIPYCPECESPMSIMSSSNGELISGTNKIQWYGNLQCHYHPREYKVPIDGYGDFVSVKDLIQQKIQDGSWDDVVTRQRILRGW